MWPCAPTTCATRRWWRGGSAATSARCTRRPTSCGATRPRRTVTHLSAGHLNRWTFLIDGQRRALPVRGTLRANSTWLALEMVQAGLGLGWLSTLLVGPAVARGELVEVLAPFRDPTWYPVHAVMLPDRDRLPRIRAVVAFLAEALWPGGPSDAQPG